MAKIYKSNKISNLLLSPWGNRTSVEEMHNGASTPMDSGPVEIITSLPLDSESILSTLLFDAEPGSQATFCFVRWLEVRTNRWGPQRESERLEDGRDWPHPGCILGASACLQLPGVGSVPRRLILTAAVPSKRQPNSVFSFPHTCKLQSPVETLEPAGYRLLQDWAPFQTQNHSTRKTAPSPERSELPGHGIPPLSFLSRKASTGFQRLLPF